MDENHQDESLTQEGEPVTQEGLLKIVPFGKEFNSCTAVRHVTTAIKRKFSELCPAWGHANPHFKNWLAANTVNRTSNAGSSMHTGGSISMGEHARRMGKFKKRKTELSQVALSLDNERDVEASKEGLDIPDDYTIWNKVVTKEKKKSAFGLDLSSKLDFRNCSETSKDNLNIEQELHMWKEKAKEQEMINEEKKVKLNDAEHKLKDQGCQLKTQQKRIGSTEKTRHASYKKLNLPLPSTMSVLADDELGTGSSNDEDDNMSD
ncbi:hypothetical protein Ahy_A07g034290 [Arachis hypogaea]|uniref:Uncharacterized protein n=1 Tax=Arachis hypogaea TaxID=3818 RepID=A0A445CBF1_ARAHY|nr:hypothetical protein Ahy_A07g034290 [Arachis hypogaea]